MKDKMGSLLLSIIFIVMSIEGRSCNYITQNPTYLDLVEGASGTIFCSVSKDIDLRVLSLHIGRQKILEICDSSCNCSDTSPFLTRIRNLKDVIKAGNESTCTDLFKDKEVDRCSSSSPNNISNERREFAWIWVRPGYSSRIHFSGNISNLSFSLKNLQVNDSGSYSWNGLACHIKGDITGVTHLTVTKGSGSLSTGQWVGIVIAIIAGFFLRS